MAHVWTYYLYQRSSVTHYADRGSNPTLPDKSHVSATTCPRPSKVCPWPCGWSRGGVRECHVVRWHGNHTLPGQRRSGSVRSISRSQPVSRPQPNRNTVERVESLCCPATVPKDHCSRGDLHGRMGQNTSYNVCKPGKDLQRKMQSKNSLKILHCDFLDVFPNILSLTVELLYLWWKLQTSPF